MEFHRALHRRVRIRPALAGVFASGATHGLLTADAQLLWRAPRPNKVGPTSNLRFKLVQTET